MSKLVDGYMKVKEAKWWFAWYPIKTIDTKRVVWLKRVYREWWLSKHYFEKPEYDVTKPPKVSGSTKKEKL